MIGFLWFALIYNYALTFFIWPDVDRKDEKEVDAASFIHFMANVVALVILGTIYFMS